MALRWQPTTQHTVRALLREKYSASPPYSASVCPTLRPALLISARRKPCPCWAPPLMAQPCRLRRRALRHRRPLRHRCRARRRRRGCVRLRCRARRRHRLLPPPPPKCTRATRDGRSQHARRPSICAPGCTALALRASGPSLQPIAAALCLVVHALHLCLPRDVSSAQAPSR